MQVAVNCSQSIQYFCLNLCGLATWYVLNCAMQKNFLMLTPASWVWPVHTCTLHLKFTFWHVHHGLVAMKGLQSSPKLLKSISTGNENINLLVISMGKWLSVSKCVDSRGWMKMYVGHLTTKHSYNYYSCHLGMRSWVESLWLFLSPQLREYDQEGVGSAINFLWSAPIRTSGPSLQLLSVFFEFT